MIDIEGYLKKFMKEEYGFIVYLVNSLRSELIKEMKGYCFNHNIRLCRVRENLFHLVNTDNDTIVYLSETLNRVYRDFKIYAKNYYRDYKCSV